MCKARRGNRSCVSIRVRLVRVVSSNNTADPKYDMLVGSMTCIVHNSLVFYSCITSNHKNLGSDATVGKRSNFKNFLRTHKIMVMHSNERGECCLRTLVDRKRKRYINAVDVAIRLHDPTDPSTVTPAPPSSWHTFSSMTIPGLRSSKASGRSSVSTTAW